MIELFNKPIFVINISFKCIRLKLYLYLMTSHPTLISQELLTLLYSSISVGKYTKKTSALRIRRDLKLQGLPVEQYSNRK